MRALHPAFIPQRPEPERPRLYLPIEIPDDRRPTRREPEPERGVWIFPLNGVEPPDQGESDQDPSVIVFQL